MNTTRFIRDLNVRVYFADDKYSLFSIDTLTTCADLEIMVATKLGLKDSSPFSIIETAEFGDKEDRLLHPYDRVSEVIALWTRSHYENASLSLSYRLVYKVKYFFDIDITDSVALELYYIQAVRDILDMRYLCTNQDCYVLAALQLQEEYGDCAEQERIGAYFRHNMKRYLPSYWIPNGIDEAATKGREHIEHKILQMHMALSGYNQIDARVTYLDFVSKLPVYGCQFFMVQVAHEHRIFKT